MDWHMHAYVYRVYFSRVKYMDLHSVLLIVPSSSLHSSIWCTYVVAQIAFWGSPENLQTAKCFYPSKIVSLYVCTYPLLIHVSLLTGHHFFMRRQIKVVASRLVWIWDYPSFAVITTTNSVQDFLLFYEWNKLLQMCIPLTHTVSVFCKSIPQSILQALHSNFHRHSLITMMANCRIQRKNSSNFVTCTIVHCGHLNSWSTNCRESRTGWLKVYYLHAHSLLIVFAPFIFDTLWTN